jgi:hypothetical protein
MLAARITFLAFEEPVARKPSGRTPPERSTERAEEHGSQR